MSKNLLLYEKDSKLRCESLVVGSGAGGAITANYLAKKGHDVLLLEEGPFGKLQIEGCHISNTFPSVWRDGGIIPIISNCNFVFAEGKVLGGGTVINSGLIHRMPPSIIREWQDEYQVKGLSNEELNCEQNTIEEYLDVHTENDKVNNINTIFKKGAKACGFEGMDVPIAATRKNGKLVKNNLRDTFLTKAMDSGLKIIINCRAEKVAGTHNTAKTLKASTINSRGERINLNITFKHIFICAGSIQSPLLLRRSRIKQNIGNTIQFHPTLRIVADFGKPVNAYEEIMPCFQVKEFSPSISMGSSVSLPDFIVAGLAINSSENLLHVKNLKNMAIFYVMIRSRSKGKVRNLPLNSYTVFYKLGREDVQNLSRGFARLCQVMFAAGAQRLFPSIEGLPVISSPQNSDIYLRQMLPLKALNLISIHSFGSCPMGENKQICAVDSFGKLNNFKNIYVNDGSILPGSPGVNPQGPIMTIARRNVLHNFGGSVIKV